MRQTLALAALAAALATPPAHTQGAFLVEDLEPFSSLNLGSNPTFQFSLGGRALFTAQRTEPPLDPLLWSTDGTAAGTERLAPVPAGARPAGELLGRTLLVGFVSEPESRFSMWLSDGTAAGSTRIPVAGVAPLFGADRAGGGRFFFFASNPNPSPQTELWVTDGTAAGTRRVASLGERTGIAGTMVGNHLAFLSAAHAAPPECGLHEPPPICDEPIAWQVWASDGTAAGTGPIADAGAAPPLQVPATFHHATATGLYFSVSEEATNRTELFFTRGRASNTVRLALYRRELALHLTPTFAEHEGRVYFFAESEQRGEQLWASDGTPAGTRRLTDLRGVSPIVGLLTSQQIAFVNGRVLFLARDDVSGRAVWSYDGPDRTVRLTDSCPGPCSSVSEGTNLVALGHRVYFSQLGEGFGAALWETDGTPEGTRQLFDPGQINRAYVSTQLLLSGDALFFAVTEPTPDAATTTEIYTLRRGEATPRALTRFKRPAAFDAALSAIRVGNRLFFATDDGTHGVEPWVVSTTPNPDSARLITDLAIGNGPSSDPVGLTRLGEKALFFACQGEEVALWATTGRLGEVERLQTLEPSCSRFRSTYQYFQSPPIIAAGGLAFHRAEEDGQVWVTDGTAAGTRALTSFEPTPPFGRSIVGPVRFGNRVALGRLVVDEDGVTTHWQLWVSDGTAAGTVLVLTTPFGGPFELYAGPDRFYFSLVDLTQQRVLFGSDGTAAGTRQLLSGTFDPRAAKVRFDDPPAAEFVRFRGRDYFTGFGGLRRTDGTAAGTELLVGLWGQSLGRSPARLTVWNDALYLLNESQPTGQISLWRTDGTAAGTSLLADFGYSSALSISDLVPFGDHLYAVASTGDGQGHGARFLFQTDGTAAGTRTVGPDLTEREVVSCDLRAMGGRLYFVASSAESGAELWESDGTDAGTGPVVDLSPGAVSSEPYFLAALSDRLLVSANDGLHGREVWALPASSGSCPPSATALCLGRGRYRAEAVFQFPGGSSAPGLAAPLTPEAGAFSFFRAGNLDLFVKVLDGGAVNGHGWVFVGSLSDASFTLTLTDTETGITRRYSNLRGQFASFADTAAFDLDGALREGGLTLPRAASAESSKQALAGVSAGGCAPAPGRLCLVGGRYAVEIDWRTAMAQGHATMVPESDTSGSFWFFRASNLEGAVKMIDGTAVNGHAWFFFTGLTNIQLAIRVRDTRTGLVRTYNKPRGRFAAFADVEAL